MSVPLDATGFLAEQRLRDYDQRGSVAGKPGSQSSTAHQGGLMAVQARFYVAEITQYAYNPGNAKVTLQASTKGPENKTWAAATPGGRIEMTIGNAAAADWFRERLGTDVAIRFTDVEPEA